MHLTARIEKRNIDIAKRTVIGIAQVEDAPDHQGDVVDFAASQRAFSKWVGNVREMHQKKAVGKCLNWQADPLTKSIAVKVKISTGAEDTWQKVLDGTLSAFSIGGYSNESQREFNKSTGQTYNRITDYVLTELSLVDSPANPRCVVTAIHKSKSGASNATDVLDQLQGGSSMGKSFKARAAIRGIAKSLADKDELLVIKKSDIVIQGTGDSATFLLKKTAVPAVITKDDAAEGGYMSDDDDTNPGDMGGVDWEDHASNAANMHKDMCGAAGIDDHVGHYEEATKGDDDMEDALDGSSDGMGAPADQMEMGRKTGNLRKNNSRRARAAARSGRDINALVEKAVGAQLAPITKALDALTSRLGDGSAPQTRKGGEGTVVEKTIGDVLGSKPGETNAAPADGSTEGRYTELQKSWETHNTRAQALIAKMNAKQKLTPEEEVERTQIGKAMGKIEVEQAEIKRIAAGL